MQKWRFLDTGSLEGPQNMAVDEALLHSFDSHSSRPVLRLYGWSPPALSLGRFQKAGDILDIECCRAATVPVVRRITGGGVIFHADELTYSIVCAPHHIPDSHSIKDSFRVLTGFLMQFYRNLGLDAAYAVESRVYGEKLGERATFCFAGKETFDILVNGRKIGGNAQRRMKRIIFQHGSIPIVDRVEDAMQFLRERPTGLEQRVTCLTGEGIALDTKSLKARLKAAFLANFDVLLLDEPLTGGEQKLADRLENEKYLSDSWNLNGEGE